MPETPKRPGEEGARRLASSGTPFRSRSQQSAGVFVTASDYDMMFGLGAVIDPDPRRGAPALESRDSPAPAHLPLDDAEWSAWSNREIAKACRVSEGLVRDMRPEVTTNIRSDTLTYTSRSGSVSTMNTSDIGRRPASETSHAVKASQRAPLAAVSRHADTNDTGRDRGPPVTLYGEPSAGTVWHTAGDRLNSTYRHIFPARARI